MGVTVICCFLTGDYDDHEVNAISHTASNSTTTLPPPQQPPQAVVVAAPYEPQWETLFLARQE